MKNKLIIKNVFSGLIVGTSMLIPGLSGGTIAIIIGIYDKLIHAISSITKLKEVKKNLWFLFQFSLGSVISIVAFSRLIELLLSHFYLPMMFLFIGVIVGSLPTIFKKANLSKDKPNILNFIYIIIGLLICTLITLIPKELISFENELSIQSILVISVAGLVIAIALILPGISVSHMLLILGLYETTLSAIKNMSFSFLIPLVVSIGIGILITTRALEQAMFKHPKATYLIIIGFVIASILDILPNEIPTGINILFCFLTFFAGFTLILFISKALKKHSF